MNISQSLKGNILCSIIIALAIYTSGATSMLLNTNDNFYTDEPPQNVTYVVDFYGSSSFQSSIIIPDINPTSITFVGFTKRATKRSFPGQWISIALPESFRPARVVHKNTTLLFEESVNETPIMVEYPARVTFNLNGTITLTCKYGTEVGKMFGGTGFQLKYYRQMST